MPMYSPDWFETFAATVPAAIIATELDGIGRVLPRAAYPRLLDVGCGIGRIAGPLAARGYAVTGLDISVAALRDARQRHPGPRYVALDQRHVGHMPWVFDGALVLWNSLGFAGRGADLDMMAGLARVVRRDGRVVLDLYHPEWLARNDKSGEPDARGPAVRRWTRDGRCFHEIRYASGVVDDIQFDVYQPDEARDLCRRAGFAPRLAMTGWDAASPPRDDAPRYQLVCERR